MEVIYKLTSPSGKCYIGITSTLVNMTSGSFSGG